MKSGKIVVVLLLTLLIGGAAFYFSDKQMAEVEDTEGGVVYLPNLMNKINQVAKVELKEDGNSTHLTLKDGRWVVEEKSAYDADFAKVKKLLMTLAELKTIEAKTSKTENYGRLGVQGVDVAGDVASRQITLSDKSGNIMHTLIVGKNKPSRISQSGAATYVRKHDEIKSWLVSGNIEIPESQISWLSTSIINIESSRIKSVKLRHFDKSQLQISKKEKTEKTFTIEGLPDKAGLKSENEVNAIADVLQNLSFEDVINRNDLKIDDEKISQANFNLFDGLQLIAKIAQKDDKHYLWFDTKSTLDDEEIAKESSELNAKFALWIYEISSINAEIFQRKLEDLIKIEG